jgi:hypothetical protein
MFFGGTSLTQSNFFSNSIHSSLKSDTKVLKVGEIPVDTVNTSSMPIFSSQKGKDGKSNPNSQNTSFLAPQTGEGTWTRKGDMPFTNVWGPACEFGEKIYVFLDSGGTWEYDPESDKWTEKASSDVRSYSGAAVVKDKIYVTTEWNGMYEYDPIADKWTKKANSQFAKRSSALAVLDEKIYAIGGLTPPPNNDFLSSVEEYDPVEDKWTKKNDLPFAWCVGSACTIDGKMYIFGGSTVGEPSSITMEYDPQKDEWKKRANMILGKAFLPIYAPIVDGKAYVIGGYREGVIVSDVQIYDPEKDEWTKGPDMPTARYGPSNATYKGKIFVFGGGTNPDVLAAISTAIFEVYDVNSGNTKSVNAEGKLPSKWGLMKQKG